jgi:hypothetical protein
VDRVGFIGLSNVFSCGNLDDQITHIQYIDMNVEITNKSLIQSQRGQNRRKCVHKCTKIRDRWAHLTVLEIGK